MSEIEKKQSKRSFEMYRRAIIDSIWKLNPRNQVRNPVMFVVEVGCLLTTGLWIQAITGKGEAPTWFIAAIAIWLWITVLFANFSEALAEGHGKAQAEALRKTRQETRARKITQKTERGIKPLEFRIVMSTEMRQNDLFMVEAGDIIPVD